MVSNIKKSNNSPLLLLILDGWGIAPPSIGNAIELARTPGMDHYLATYPNTLLRAHGQFVGLPKGQEGNSEAGHSNLGAGRVVEQDAVHITETIENGTFFKNPAFSEAIGHCLRVKSEIHLMGLLSNGSSAHSDPKHLLALLELLKKHGIPRINLHLFTDGRDSPKYEAIKLIRELEKTFTGQEQICTIMGRFYAMDRKKYWPRTEFAYNVLTLDACDDCKYSESAEMAVIEAYNRGESDEFIQPRILTKQGRIMPRIKSGDSIIFFNMRSDRARQIAKVFVQPDFTDKNPGSFTRKKVLEDIRFVAMTDFGPDLDQILTAFPSVDLEETLTMQLKDYRQLYIAETEKYAHVTFFFNGGYSAPVAGEERTLIASPNVRSYDETPAMSTAQLAYEVVGNLKKKKYDFTTMNFAAPDMIGHTGNLQAAIKCVEAVDKYTKFVVDEYLKVGGTVLLTADHGNIEEMINLKNNEINTEHTTNPVPFIFINKDLKNKIRLANGGYLADIAPTILQLFNLAKPKAMTRKSLIQK
jgi:2,3-bisphosphoglycerate-independent phosphoglycerate mutase